MVVQYSQESNDDAGERQRVEDGVQQLDVDASEASADAVQEHGETAEGDKSSHHKRRVQVELLVGQVVSPGIALAVVEHPEDGQG